MGRKKKVVVVEEAVAVIGDIVEVPKELIIVPLSIDYNNEGLNNMARKINEIISYLNGTV